MFEGQKMKVTLDLDHLLNEGKITYDEYEKLHKLAVTSTGALAFNSLIGFGVIAVSGAALALVPAPVTAIIIGVLALIAGVVLLRRNKLWQVLANICVLIGALMAGGGVVVAFAGSFWSILFVAFVFALVSIFSKSALLAALAILTLFASLGARTGYFHANYVLEIQAPMLTIILFGLLAVGLYWWSKRVSVEYERIAIISARTSVFLVNLGFWVGSLWGERLSAELVISDAIFAVLWAFVLVVMGIWSWRHNRRWGLNMAVIFGGIHFYTQWFEHLGTSPETVLIAGGLMLGMAVGLREINRKVKKSLA